MTSTRARAPYRYRAFISYSHGADNRLAPALRTALHRLAKPWYRLRAMRVFRDETGLGVTPALWPAIEAALMDSEYFLLLASPDAAASKWVQLELGWWLDHRPPDRLLIALTRGDICWDDAAQDFDWGVTDSLPRRLSGTFEQSPKYVDLRWARTATDLSLRNPDFLTAVAGVASTLQGLPLDELIGEDVRQHRRTRRVATAAATGLAVLAVAAIGFGVIASLERDEARRQEGIAFQQSRIATDERDQARRRVVQLNCGNGQRAADIGDVSAAMLWFAEAAMLEADHPSEQRLLLARLASLDRKHPRLEHVWSAAAPSTGIAFTADGESVVVYPPEGSVQAWDARTGSASFNQPGNPGVDVGVTSEGRRLLTIDGPCAQLRDPLTGEAVRALEHDAGVAWAGFAAADRLVLTRADDRTAHAWDSGSGLELAALGDVDEIFDVALDADAVTLLVKSSGEGLTLWESATKRRTVLDDKKVQAAELSADRRYVLAFHDDSSAAVWDTGTGLRVTSLGDWQAVDRVLLSPDGQRAALTSRQGWAMVWDIESDREVRTLTHQGAVLDAAFSPDGKRLATVGTDQQAHVWSIATGKQVTPPLWHESTVSRIAFSPDGNRLATSTANHLVRLWDVSDVTGATMKHESSVQFASFSPDGTHVLTMTDFTAHLWDVRSAAPTREFTFAPGPQIYCAAFSPDGAYVVTGSEDRLARLWDVKTGEQIGALQHARRVKCAAFSRDGKRLLTASDDQLNVWDLAALPQVPREPTTAVPHDGSPVETCEFSPDARQALSRDFHGTTRMWNLDSATERTELRREDTILATLSRDGTWMATAGPGSVVQVRATDTAAPAGEPTPSKYRVTVVAFSPDGRRVLTADQGGVARVWDTKSGNPVTPPMCHDDRIQHAVFNADGTQVLTASSDGTARVWNAESGQPITEPLQHRGEVGYAEFGPDGQHVVTASYDDTARLWDLSPGRLDVRGWMQRAQLLGSRRVDATGAVITVDTAPYLELWRDVEQGR